MIGIGARGTLDLLRHILQWRRDGTGMLATPLAEGGAFLKSDPSLDRPDLQLHFCVGIVDDHGRRLHLGYGFSCHVCVLRPFSRGEVGLNDANPLSPPRIDPRYLSDERDASLLLKGAGIMRSILEAPALARFRDKELHMKGVVSDEEMMEHIKATSRYDLPPGRHSPRMGIDEMAVVDPNRR